MDVAALYTQFLEWGDQNPGWENQKNQTFSGGKILFAIKDHMVVFAPWGSSDVVKVWAKKPFSDIAEERDILNRLSSTENGQKALGSDLYAIPKFVSCGKDPNHIVMTDMGPNYGQGFIQPEDREKAIQAIGAFAADLWERDGSIHIDLNWNNITKMRDGRVGIIDILSVEKTEKIEKMFLVPLAQEDGDFAYRIASLFTERTGVRVDLDSLRTLCLEENSPLIRGWKKYQPEWAETAQKRIKDNLDAWEDALSKESRSLPSSRSALTHSMK